MKPPAGDGSGLFAFFVTLNFAARVGFMNLLVKAPAKVLEHRNISPIKKGRTTLLLLPPLSLHPLPNYRVFGLFFIGLRQHTGKGLSAASSPAFSGDGIQRVCAEDRRGTTLL